MTPIQRTLSAGILLACIATSGCAQYENRRGVEVAWDQAGVAQLERGKSTRRDVLDLLGPPSQVISLDGETALYYLFEHASGEGLVLLLYNRVNIDTRYDRAIFFFDDDELLTEFSTQVNDAD